ncbi:MAG: glycerol-3-phosphate dehydrogenase/oxidase [Chitinophagaceae bacterium]|nr:glycerol-3-phosphate dehydrogenase/oxidase [Chitinophagaceae bacterium]
MNRQQFIQSLSVTPEWDICIIGGGATGLGTALDAASRGLKTVLFERSDFAKGTSSKSTKLVHGGVRYLQQGNIKLVKEALRERGLLLQNAPHLVRNQPFIVPNYKWWEKPFYGIGLKIYDKMAGNLGLGPSLFLSKKEVLEQAPTLDAKGLKGGILYHDGQFDDARMAISLAQKAAEYGASVLNYFPVTGFLKTKKKIAGVIVQDALTGKIFEVKSRCVINATGVFTDSLQRLDDKDHRDMIKPSQGIHLVVDKEFLPGEAAIMIPRTDDGRVLFAVPWHDKIVLGTTDTAVDTISDEPKARAEEIDFILQHTGRYLNRHPSINDVRSVFAGLRPLVKGKSKKTAALSRDHLIHESDSGLISISGGKWTTYRKMAEDVTDFAIAQAKLEALPCSTKTISLGKASQIMIPAAVKDLPESLLRLWIQKAVDEELCMTVEDFLSRRSRQLLLDAKASQVMANQVATLMAVNLQKDEDWINEQINIFKTVSQNYLPN